MGDYCTVTSSKRIFAEQYVESGVPFYRSREIIEKNNNSDISEPLFISPKVYENIKAKFGVPQKDDMLLTSVGTIGIPYIVKDEQFYFKDGNLTWMKDFSDELSSKYLYYWLSSKFGKESLTNRCIGSSQAALTIDILKKYKLLIPNRKTQDKIVSVLSAYDNLIEVNNKRVKVLEQMVENLYKEWFVRFRFPGHEEAEFEDGIPKGWERNHISKFYLTSSGGTPSRDNGENYDNGTIPWVKTGELQDCLLVDTEEKITEAAIKKSSAKLFPKDSVLMAMYGVNIGMLAYSTMDATCNQACCVFKDKATISTKHYLFQYLKSIRDYLLLIGFGAAQQNLSQDLIKRVKIVMPDKDTLIRFEQEIEPLYDETKLLLKANNNLIQQRDLLLPRLMSGKLEV